MLNIHLMVISFAIIIVIIIIWVNWIENIYYVSFKVNILQNETSKIVLVEIIS